MMTIVADEVGNHDTIGACSQESNTCAMATTKHQHACVENFLIEGAAVTGSNRPTWWQYQLLRRWPVDPDGSLGIVDGLSAPGKRLALRADTDTLVLIQLSPDQQPVQRFRSDHDPADHHHARRRRTGVAVAICRGPARRSR